MHHSSAEESEWELANKLKSLDILKGPQHI